MNNNNLRVNLQVSVPGKDSIDDLSSLSLSSSVSLSLPLLDSDSDPNITYNTTIQFYLGWCSARIFPKEENLQFLT
jgi:hypothetical protein